MSASVPVSTHASESAVINAPIDSVWSAVSNLDFSWWGLVNSTVLKHGASKETLGAVISILFKDGVSWDVQIQEISNINNSVTFEVIQSEPAASVASVVHTISLKRVTATNATFVEWVSDFSNDATAEIISDSRFKRLEAFNDLAASLTK